MKTVAPAEDRHAVRPEASVAQMLATIVSPWASSGSESTAAPAIGSIATQREATHSSACSTPEPPSVIGPHETPSREPTVDCTGAALGTARTRGSSAATVLVFTVSSLVRSAVFVHPPPSGGGAGGGAEGDGELGGGLGGGRLGGGAEGGGGVGGGGSNGGD